MMLEPLFGSNTREQVLQYILANEEGYASEIAKFYNVSVDPVKKQLDRLELGGILVNKKYGRSFVYSFSPRYAFINELKNLLLKARNYYEPDLLDKLVNVRLRPRRKDKPND